MIGTISGFLLAAAVQASPASPAAPDYRQDAAWLCRPGRSDPCSGDQDLTVVAADGTRTIERFRRASAPAFDCFYIYPTVSLDPAPNSDTIAGEEERRVAYAQAARFASRCRVFAPLYRQVTLTALRGRLAGRPMTTDPAIGLADVTAAWNDYLARDNGGRGVVLIGHSQGAMVLKALIADAIENSPAQDRIISAMLIGINFAVLPGQPVGGDLRTMPLCRSADQFGCVVTYVSFRRDTPPPANSHFGRAGQAGMRAACTNPAALGGGRAAADAIFTTGGPGASAAPMGPWTSDGAAIATPFVRTPGLISTECLSADGFDYLAVTVNADPGDPRTDTIVGDVVVNGAALPEWGLHLIDMPIVMGDLISLADRQAAAWRRAQERRP